LRVLFLHHEFPALSETFVLDQVLGLIERGLDVKVIALRPRDEAQIHSVVRDSGVLDRTVYTHSDAPIAARLVEAGGHARHFASTGRSSFLSRLAGRSFKRPFQKLRLARAIEEAAPDVVICHYGDNGEAMMRLCEAIGLHPKIVTLFHGYDLSSQIAGQTSPYRELFGKGWRFLPVTEFWRKKLVSLGCPADRIRVHRMGVKIGVGPAPPVNREHRPITLLMTGRMVEKKGHQFAVHAFARAVTERPDLLPMKLVLAGDGPLRAELEALAVSLGIRAPVYFLGAVTREEVETLLSEADLFLLPSVTAADGDMEGLPVSLLEAMASQLPVLSTLHSGIPEAVADRSSGFLVPERDVDALTARLVELCESADTRKWMGREGRRIVAEKFNADIWNDRLVDLLKEAD
jgi:colanic acid/amylovoran biosynthesis glycosyltransferase